VPDKALQTSSCAIWNCECSAWLFTLHCYKVGNKNYRGRRWLSAIWTKHLSNKNLDRYWSSIWLDVWKAFPTRASYNSYCTMCEARRLIGIAVWNKFFGTLGNPSRKVGFTETWSSHGCYGQRSYFGSSFCLFTYYKSSLLLRHFLLSVSIFTWQLDMHSNETVRRVQTWYMKYDVLMHDLYVLVSFKKKILSREDGSSMFFRDNGIYQFHTDSLPGRPKQTPQRLKNITPPILISSFSIDCLP
jgi:hypothetical protein